MHWLCKPAPTQGTAQFGHGTPPMVYCAPERWRSGRRRSGPPAAGAKSSTSTIFWQGHEKASIKGERPGLAPMPVASTAHLIVPRLIALGRSPRHIPAGRFEAAGCGGACSSQNLLGSVAMAGNSHQLPAASLVLQPIGKSLIIGGNQAPPMTTGPHFGRAHEPMAP